MTLVQFDSADLSFDAHGLDDFVLCVSVDDSDPELFVTVRNWWLERNGEPIEATDALQAWLDGELSGFTLPRWLTDAYRRALAHADTIRAESCLT